MKLGLVTYQMAADWDLATLIAHCRAAGFHGVELRTTHRHGVEDTLSAAQRREVRAQFADSGVACYCLGTAFEYHSPSPEVVREQVTGSIRYLQLARDLGVEGIKIRPNTLPADIPEAQTLEQIGRAFREVAAAGAELGVKVWMEVHGHHTCRVDRMKRICEVADHPNAMLTWNCNRGEVDEHGSIAAAFDLLKERIGCVHIHELHDESKYPYTELFRLLKRQAFTGYTSYEGPGSSDPVTVMKYYRKAWELLVAYA